MDGTDTAGAATIPPMLAPVLSPPAAAAAVRGFDPTVYKDGMLDEVKLDDFEVKMPSGRVVHPHAGESVWLMPYGFSLADELRVAEFAGLPKDAPHEQQEAAFEAIADLMARLIVGWNITGPTGVPYPQPSEGGSAIKAIPSRLFKYVLDQLRGEEPEGNAGGGSAA